MTVGISAVEVVEVRGHLEKGRFRGVDSRETGRRCKIGESRNFFKNFVWWFFFGKWMEGNEAMAEGAWGFKRGLPLSPKLGRI